MEIEDLLAELDDAARHSSGRIIQFGRHLIPG